MDVRFDESFADEPGHDESGVWAIQDEQDACAEVERMLNEGVSIMDLLIRRVL
jgi:hypothetical protein